MIIAELPYVSDFLKKTVVYNQFDLIQTENTSQIFESLYPRKLNANKAIEAFKKNKNQKLFTNSENSIAWIIQNLSFTDLPRQIELFKNKVKFREFMQPLHPHYFFQEIDFKALSSVDIAAFPAQFVIKPAVGFFSMGVYMVNSHDEWPTIVAAIQTEIEQVKSIYPAEVFNHTKFIAEEIIEGDEYAFDAYYSASGEPVILNIFRHPFASGDDVSDRVYLTSKEVVTENLDRFTNWLAEIGTRASLHNFPLHVEVRVNEKGEIQPIEVNPLRYGGFCTTADCTWFSYGVNSYEYFFNEQKPDWNDIFSSREGKLYSLVVLNNSTGYKGREIKKFQFDKLAKKLEKPLEIRPINYRKFPLFGFVFTETKADNYAELEYLLRSDLKEFVELN